MEKVDLHVIATQVPDTVGRMINIIIEGELKKLPHIPSTKVLD